MTVRSLRPSSEGIVPAELAARLTLALAVLLVAFEVISGALWTPTLRVLYVAMAVVVAAAVSLKSLSERQRGWLVVATWLASGWTSLFVAVNLPRFLGQLP